jgi:hypothetical protein
LHGIIDLFYAGIILLRSELMAKPPTGISAFYDSIKDAAKHPEKAQLQKSPPSFDETVQSFMTAKFEGPAKTVLAMDDIPAAQATKPKISDKEIEPLVKKNDKSNPGFKPKI